MERAENNDIGNSVNRIGDERPPPAKRVVCSVDHGQSGGPGLTRTAKPRNRIHEARSKCLNFAGSECPIVNVFIFVPSAHAPPKYDNVFGRIRRSLFMWQPLKVGRVFVRSAIFVCKEKNRTDRRIFVKFCVKNEIKRRNEVCKMLTKVRVKRGFTSVYNTLGMTGNARPSPYAYFGILFEHLRKF